MSGGKRIDDHSSWMGKGSKGSVFPEGAKVKHEQSANGAGAVGKYEDTTEAIKSVQSAGQGKISGNKLKDGYRY